MPGFAPASSAAVALTVLSGCCVVARLFSRLAFVKHVGIDDCLIALAWSASLALTVVTTTSSTQVATESPDSSTLLQFKASWSTTLTYNLGALFLKDSLLVQYLRFSTDTGYQRACWALGTIVTAYGVSALFVGIFSCQPIAFSWDESISDGRCIDIFAFWLFNASFNSATDIIICVLPIPVLRVLSLPRKQTLILSLLFLLGAFVCAASIARLVVVYTVTVKDENDSSLLLWSTIEINVGIICACLPSLRHPVTQFSPRIFAHKRKTSDGSEVRSHTSINVEIKHSRSNSQSMGYRRGSLTSEVSYPRNSNVIDFSYFGSEDLEDSRDRDPDHENEISTVSSNLPTPDTPTSLLFDIESQNPFDSLTGTPHHASPASDKNKPLPLPPSPVLPSPVLIMPAPVTRPAGPRSLQSSSKVFTMRSHKVRYEPRTILPLACIPESQSPITSPRRGSPQIGRRDGSTGLCKSSPPPDSDHDEDRNYSHERARRTTAPPVPPYYDPNAGGGNTSTSYGNIAPWDACPCPGSKTYSYEILGGPRALGKDATRSLSWRQRARRDKERAQWAKRNEQQRKERESRNRPNGPRQLD